MESVDDGPYVLEMESPTDLADLSFCTLYPPGWGVSVVLLSFRICMQKFTQPQWSRGEISSLVNSHGLESVSLSMRLHPTCMQSSEEESLGSGAANSATKFVLGEAPLVC